MEISLLIIILNLLSCDAALRIIGGRDAINNEFPYAVRLEGKIVNNINGTSSIHYLHTCSGAAISSKWILTAAHCYKNLEPYEGTFEAIARYNSYFPEDLGQISPVLKVYYHPQYNMQRFQRHQNDIALLLSKNLFVSQYGKISAVDYKALVGHKVYILGFGITNATASEKPLQVLEGMMNNCLELEKSYPLHKATMMCVVPSCNVKAKACPGDSGGPVVHSSGIVGVNALSKGPCSESGDIVIYPGHSAVVVSMISHELNWVSSIISN